MSTVFLDLDGTLTDPALGITNSVNFALSELGHPTCDPPEMGWMIGPPLLDTFARLGVSDPHAALDLYRVQYTKTGLFENVVYDGIPDQLRALKTLGYDLCLMTPKPHAYARRITKHFGLNTFMRAEYGPELDGTFNNKAELLAFALTDLPLDPSACLMIGDRSHDILAGQSNSVATLAVTWGYGSPDEWQQATATCASVQDLSRSVSTLLPPPSS